MILQVLRICLTSIKPRPLVSLLCPCVKNKLQLLSVFFFQGSDVRSLLGRSLARAKATYYAGALADAARAAGM